VYAFVYVLQQAGGVDGDEFGLAKFARPNLCCASSELSVINTGLSFMSGFMSGMNLPILSISFQ